MGADQSSANGSGNLQGTPTLDDAYLERVTENIRELSVTESNADHAQVLNTDTSSGDGTFVANYLSEGLSNMQHMLQHNNINPEEMFITLFDVFQSDDFKDTIKKSTEQYDAAESDAQKKEILNSYTKNLMHMGMTAVMDAANTNTTTSAPNSLDIDVD